MSILRHGFRVALAEHRSAREQKGDANWNAPPVRAFLSNQSMLLGSAGQSVLRAARSFTSDGRLPCYAEAVCAHRYDIDSKIDYRVGATSASVYGCAQNKILVFGHAVSMDWTAAAIEWKDFRNEVHANWAKLTHSQLNVIAGQRTSLAKHICASYGVTLTEAERQICSFEARNEYLRAVSSR